MSGWEMLVVFLAGIWGGTINTVVGSGTLVTFPVLLGVGLPPVTANVSNAIGLFPGSFVGAWGYRRELATQGKRIRALAPVAAAGAAGGAALLFALPSKAFDAIVPVLIGMALLLVVFGPRLTARLAIRRSHASDRVTPLLFAAMLLIAVYGGYFGATIGVMMMAVFGVLLAEPIQHQNGLKNLLAGVINLVAAIVFVCTVHVDWAAAALVAAGAMLGGVLGARIGRRLSPTALRAIIVVVGVAAIVKLLA